MCVCSEIVECVWNVCGVRQWSVCGRVCVECVCTVTVQSASVCWSVCSATFLVLEEEEPEVFVTCMYACMVKFTFCTCMCIYMHAMLVT